MLKSTLIVKRKNSFRSLHSSPKHPSEPMMTKLFSQKASYANCRGAEQYLMRKQINGRGRAFSGARMKELNALAKRNRTIRRSKGGSARVDRRFKCSQCISSDVSIVLDLNHPNAECESQEFSQEKLIPQKQWDELFDSAFEAIGEISGDLFHEQ
jgi:hypothetical protein